MAWADLQAQETQSAVARPQQQQIQGLQACRLPLTKHIIILGSHCVEAWLAVGISGLQAVQGGCSLQNGFRSASGGCHACKGEAPWTEEITASCNPVMTCR